MRKLLGGAVLVVGTGVLGWYGSSNHAENMQTTVSARALAAASGTVHPISTSVSGRDITVSGTADGEDERDQIIAALNDVHGRRLVRDDLTVLETASPFVLNAQKDAAGMQYAGLIPTEAARQTLATRIGADANALKLMAGAPDANWTGVVGQGIDSLSVLEDGVLDVSDRTVTLSGTAFSPAEAEAAQAALGNLPEGYDAAFNLTLLDDGLPPNFDVMYNAASGASASGKLPADLDSAGIAAALGLADIQGDAAQGLIGESPKTQEQLGILSAWLPEMESLSLNSTDDTVSLTAEAAPGVDAALLQSSLSAALGDSTTVSISDAANLPAEGTDRTNQATGQQETFTQGFWLPVVDFTSDLSNCDSQSAQALQKDRVNFVTGSAQLDAQSIRTINAVAAIIRKCVDETDLTVEIGGHTDNQGADDLNQQLSQSRAASVRSALIARGVPEVGISAVGYGATQPIADNNTEEGRAANRRTAITWSEPAAATPAAPATPQDTDNNTSAGE